MAVKAGVASVEHGSFIDEEGIELMKQHGTYLVADIYNDDYIMSEYAKMGYPEKILNKERLVGKAQRENFEKAARAGVKIAYGTDAGVYPAWLECKTIFLHGEVWIDTDAGDTISYHQCGRFIRVVVKGWLCYCG